MKSDDGAAVWKCYGHDYEDDVPNVVVAVVVDIVVVGGVFDLEGVAAAAVAAVGCGGGAGKVAMPSVVSFDVVSLLHHHLPLHIHHQNHYHNQQAERKQTKQII